MIKIVYYENWFEDLDCWKKSIQLALQIYEIFDDRKDYWFKNQIQRAWISISNNIAEWHERQTNKEFKQFLYIAKWSCWEVRNMLIIWNKLWYISDKDFNKLFDLSLEISKMLQWFIRSLNH